MYRSNNSSSSGSGSNSGSGVKRSYSGSSRKPTFNRGRSFQKRRPQGQSIDVSKFINKAVITEVIEHFVPEHNFADFQVSDRLKNNIIAKGYTIPTPIQDRAIPHVLRGSDVVGVANTGTGKTAAFLIPLINKVLSNPTKENVLIVVPTRELALQIEDEFKGFAKLLGIFSVGCVGGANIGRQISNLRHRNNFVIGTPGRLRDLIERRVLDLSKFNTVVLDEADRMLDMGFITDVRFMLSRTPKDRQTLFFSATLSGEIDGLIKEFLREPVTISVKTRDTAKTIDQDIIRVKADKKIDALHDLLIRAEFNKVLVFGRTKHGVEKLSKILNTRGFKAESIHGDKNQARRQKALALFKESRVQILVATDVAARGLDISDISHVINYDLPATYEDYVHRVGRTGRGGKAGKALTFVE